MTASLQELIDAPDADQDNKAVWISGGYMSMAEMLRRDNPVKSKEYLYEAKKYITDLPRLKARAEQWGMLRKENEGE